MSSTPLQETSRRTTVIFWIMTALFTAQMVWWIVFQVSSSDERLALNKSQLELQRHRALEAWRDRVHALEDSLTAAWSEFDTPAALSVAVSHLDGWRTVGYRRRNEQSIIATNPSEGKPIGQLAIPVAAGIATITLDALLMHQLCAQQFPTVEYTPVSDTGREPDDAVTIDHLAISADALAEIEDEQRARLRMFVGEGAFFLLLIAAGAFTIHRALRRTREFERRQQNFLAAVTHELKAPLASIRLYGETLSTHTLPEEKYRECLDRINQDVDRLQGMIDDTLEAGVFAKRAFHLHREERDLSVCLNRYIEMYEGRAGRAGVEIERDLEPGVIVSIDDAQLRRAIGAVIGNAVKYTHLSESGRTVSVALTARDRRAIIRVADEGVGIDPADQRRVFERFYRSGDELTRRVSGSGLGLYLAREIIEAHKGTIALRSDGIGRGTTVTIELPVVRSGAATA
ncbi:MAG: hypothetical protein GF341_07750 [candidate division Zixibacteria bacterium]|nr:hypothetical protein [candidate division Zixibacteria bacterium]